MIYENLIVVVVFQNWLELQYLEKMFYWHAKRMSSTNLFIQETFYWHQVRFFFINLIFCCLTGWKVWVWYLAFFLCSLKIKNCLDIRRFIWEVWKQRIIIRVKMFFTEFFMRWLHNAEIQQAFNVQGIIMIFKWHPAKDFIVVYRAVWIAFSISIPNFAEWMISSIQYYGFIKAGKLNLIWSVYRQINCPKR